MPIKQRRGKARAFDEYHREQLIGGPDTSLLAGVGYLAGRMKWFRHMDDAERAEVLAEMEADWRIHGAELMKWWNAGGNAPFPGAKPWTFPFAGGPDRLPWAAEQFGDPGDEPCP